MISRKNLPGNVRTGVAAVELAALSPLLAMLLIGVWEVGRMVEVEQVLVNAAREGGRQASTGIMSPTSIKTAVVQYLKSNGITTVTNSDVTITNLTNSSRSDPTAANQLDHFRVSVTIPFNSVRWVLLSQLTNITSLSGYADWYSMRDIPITVDSSIPLS